MDANHGSLQQIKTRIYKSVLILGAIVPLVIWFFDFENNSTNYVNRFFLPLLAILCLVSIILFRRIGSRFLGIFEAGIYSIVFLYMFFFILYVARIGIDSGMFELQKFLLWMPMVYIAAFIMFNAKTALRLCLLYFILTASVMIGYLLITRDSPYLGMNQQLIFEVLSSNIMYIIIMYVIILLKERVTESDIRAAIMSEFAYTDSLTGLFNRRKLYELMEFYIKHQIKFSIIMADVDNFKSVNDRYGHARGDQVLVDIAAQIRDVLRSHDFVGRLGGDEFVIICPGANRADTEMLKSRIESINETEALMKLGCQLSFGFAAHATDETLDSLLKRADSNLYRNKRNQKSQ